MGFPLDEKSIFPLYLVWVALNVTTARLVNALLPDVYMDEPFHVPQAQAYCRGEWVTWDPKITTPPALYVSSVFLTSILRLPCNISNLRLTNLLFLHAIPPVIAPLLRSLRRSGHLASKTRSEEGMGLIAITIATFPVLWFFGFLYYTDVGSTVAVIATITLARSGRHWWAALLGIAATLFRQTNIIWVAFALASFTIQAMNDPHGHSLGSQSLHLEGDLDLKLLQRSAESATPALVTSMCLSYIGALFHLLPCFVPYALAFASFGGFIVWNGGIVLGDKSNHIPSIHVPQIFYFIAFATAFACPALLSGKKYHTLGLAKQVQKRILGSKLRAATNALVLIAIEIFIWKFTIHHPFVLSDNRHYTFYLWRRVMMVHPIVPYFLGPIYLVCGWIWWIQLGSTSTLLELVFLSACTIATLLPTPLLEPRYFIIPYTLLRAQLVKNGISHRGLLLEWAWYALINVITIGVFLFFPRDPTEGAEDLGVVRFMW